MKCKNGHSNSSGSEFCSECGTRIQKDKNNLNLYLSFIPVLLVFMGMVFSYITTYDAITEIKTQSAAIFRDDQVKEINDFSNKLVYEDASGLPAQQFRMAEWQKELASLTATRQLEIQKGLLTQNKYMELNLRNQNYFMMIVVGFLTLISFLIFKRK
jgi:hypothetical protein